jgi:hypothetical protein
MATSSKNTPMQSRLEKAARENHNLSLDYEVPAKIIREENARLKALRLAKEAVEFIRTRMRWRRYPVVSAAR